VLGTRSAPGRCASSFVWLSTLRAEKETARTYKEKGSNIFTVLLVEIVHRVECSKEDGRTGAGRSAGGNRYTPAVSKRSLAQMLCQPRTSPSLRCQKNRTNARLFPPSSKRKESQERAGISSGRYQLERCTSAYGRGQCGV
jgi:hypothetical protein